MSDIKLYYFNVRGKGEFLRLLFRAAGVQFEDKRIERADWGPDSDAKKATPYGQVPYVIYQGKKRGQSIAMGTYFARKFGFYGKTDEDAWKQEEIMHLIDDLIVGPNRAWFLEQDPQKKAERTRELTEVQYPRYLSSFERLLAENGDQGYSVGDSVTLADLCLHDVLETVLGVDPRALESFPLQRKLRANVENLPALKEYLAKRPKTVV